MGFHSKVDPEGLQEFSVVFTDRSLNHMSQKFQGVMRGISSVLKQTYNADAVAIVPGGGTYAMEAVARQFARDRKTLVLRNGWFSYRWTQIFDASQQDDTEVMKARRAGNAARTPFAPAPIEEVVAKITSEAPAVVFAPHVETSAGMILPDDYIAAMAEATHAVGGIFVLDCIASGCAWVDMAATGVDVLISAPQKGWSGTPCAGFVMMSARARALLDTTQSDSFALNLAGWTNIMAAYENGGHAYHATMPTDGLAQAYDIMLEMREFGMDKLRQAQFALGAGIRDLLDQAGFTSVAAAEFAAPGVVVGYTDDPEMKSGAKFAAEGAQIAAGVPLQCDEGAEYSSFRIGLFGLDKLKDVEGTIARFQTVLDRVLEA